MIAPCCAYARAAALQEAVLICERYVATTGASVGNDYLCGKAEAAEDLAIELRRLLNERAG